MYLSMLQPIFNFLVQFFLWSAIYKYNNISDISKNQILGYYFIIMFISIFVKTNAIDIADEFKNGTIDKELLRPIKLLNYRLIKSFGERLFQLMNFTPFYILIWFIIKSQIELNLNPIKIFLGLYFLICSFFISFFIDFIIGLSAILLAEVWAIRAITNYVINFISGYYLPLILLPVFFTSSFKYLPFYYIFYYPSILFTNNINLYECLQNMVISLVWVILLFIISNYIMKKLIKKYSSYGG